MLEPGVEGRGCERIAAKECLEERDVAEIAEQGAIAREEQLFGIVAAEPSGVHLPFEEPDGAGHEWSEDRTQAHGQATAPFVRLAPNESDEVRVFHEELEPGRENPVDLDPPVFGLLGGPFDAEKPVGQCPLKDLVIERLFGGEMVQKARPADAHRGRDVVQRRAFVPVLGEKAKRLGQDGLARGRSRVTGQGDTSGYWCALRPGRLCCPQADGSPLPYVTMPPGPASPPSR